MTLFDTQFSAANAGWLASVEDNLLCDDKSGSMFYFDTQPNKAAANIEKRAMGTDIWALFMMSGIAPERVSGWFKAWQRNLWCSREMSPMFKLKQVQLKKNHRQTN